MAQKLAIKEVMAAVDSGYIGLWDELDDEQRKALKSEFFIMNRYISNVKTNSVELQQHYLLAVNEYFNKHWNLLQKHPKLMWMLLAMCGHESKKIHYHEWIGFKKKPGNSSDKKVKFLLDIYPAKKQADCELLAELMSDADFKELAVMHGMEDAEVKKLLK